MNNTDKNNLIKQQNNRNNLVEDDEYEKSISLQSSISEFEDYTLDTHHIVEDYDDANEEQGEIDYEEQPEDDDGTEDYDEGLLTYHNEKLNAEIEVENSSTLSDYTTDHDGGFHLDILKNAIDDIPVLPKKYKNGTRKSLTFTNPQMREIERQNRILLQKILSKGPSYSNSSNKQNLKQNSATRITSAAINRKKQQRQIDSYNQILKRKIDEIGSRRKQFY